MVRIAALALAVLALAVAAGCGGGDESSPTPETVIGEVPTGEAEGSGGGAAEGDPAAGKEIYASAGCGSCHTFADAGSTGTVGPDLDQSSIDFEGAVTQISDGGGGMPPFSGELSEEDIANVAAYVTTARS